MTRATYRYLPRPQDRTPPSEAGLTVWVIYEHPKDFPHGYVLRAQWAMKDGSVQSDELAWRGNTAQELRDLLPPGLVCLVRHPNDDPAILETWI